MAHLLGATLTRLEADGAREAEAVEVARGLVEWANDQGGKDNITVALVRIGHR